MKTSVVRPVNSGSDAVLYGGEKGVLKQQAVVVVSGGMDWGADSDEPLVCGVETPDVCEACD